MLYLFSDNLPGVSAKQAIDKAIDELERFKKMKPQGKAGDRDDTDELITRAKTKKALLEEKEKSASKAAAKPAAAKPAASSTPAAGGSSGKLPDAGAKKK